VPIFKGCFLYELSIIVTYYNPLRDNNNLFCIYKFSTLFQLNQQYFKSFFFVKKTRSLKCTQISLHAVARSKTKWQAQACNYTYKKRLFDIDLSMFFQQLSNYKFNYKEYNGKMHSDHSQYDCYFVNIFKMKSAVWLIMLTRDKLPLSI